MRKIKVYSILSASMILLVSNASATTSSQILVMSNQLYQIAKDLTTGIFPTSILLIAIGMWGVVNVFGKGIGDGIHQLTNIIAVGGSYFLLHPCSLTRPCFQHKCNYMINRKQSTPFLQSMTKPILLLGGERENIILLACVSLSLCTVGRDVLSLILALLIWVVGIIASKLTAKIDPWATKVFLKSLLYRDFYNAREKINTPRCILKRGRKI